MCALLRVCVGSGAGGGEGSSDAVQRRRDGAPAHDSVLVAALVEPEVAGGSARARGGPRPRLGGRRHRREDCAAERSASAVRECGRAHFERVHRRLHLPLVALVVRLADAQRGALLQDDLSETTRTNAHDAHQLAIE